MLSSALNGVVHAIYIFFHLKNLSSFSRLDETYELMLEILQYFVLATRVQCGNVFPTVSNASEK